jgi:hypothetical protein
MVMLAATYKKKKILYFVLVSLRCRLTPSILPAQASKSIIQLFVRLLTVLIV